jgi:hypothetical protein
LDKIKEQLPVVQNVQIRLNNTTQKAVMDLQTYDDRMQDKMGQANSAIDVSFNGIKVANSVFFSHALRDEMLSFLYKPSFSFFSCLDIDKISIKSLMAAYVDEYHHRYNSAIKDASEGTSLSDELNEQCNIKK